MGQFGTKMTPKELMRENQRMLRKAMRELDRERANLEAQEKKLIVDIKTMAKKNQIASVKIMAKDLVRTRKYVQKFYQMKSHLQATCQSTEAMTSAMQGATRAMVMMNRRMNVPALQRIMREFAINSERMEMTEEVMGDAIDDVMSDEADVEEEEAIVGSVLAEIGINIDGEVPAAPGTRAAATTASAGHERQAVAAGAGGGAGAGGAGSGSGGDAPAGGGGTGDSTLDELEARLNNLRK